MPKPRCFQDVSGRHVERQRILRMTGWCKGWRAASVYALPVRRRAKRLQRRTEIVHLSTGYSFVAIETHGAAALYAQQFRLFLFIPSLYKKTQDLVGPTAPDFEARWAETLGILSWEIGAVRGTVPWAQCPWGDYRSRLWVAWHQWCVVGRAHSPKDLERHPRGNQPWL